MYWQKNALKILILSFESSYLFLENKQLLFYVVSTLMVVWYKVCFVCSAGFILIKPVICCSRLLKVVILGEEVQVSMFIKGYSIAKVAEMGCCGCFGVSSAKRQKKTRPYTRIENNISQELLLNDEVEEEEEEEEEEVEQEEDNNCSYGDDMSETEKVDNEGFKHPSKRSQDILLYRTQNGLICREFPVKETHKLVRSEVIR